MARERIVFLAASIRFVMAALGLLLLPVLAPSLATYYGVFAGYVVCAGAFQLLIWRGLLGNVRTLASGVVDAAIITFFVHLVGSVGSMTVALYAFASMINTVIAGRRVGLTIAIVCTLLYTALLISEGAGLLPFAPAGPSWIHGAPTPTELASSGALAIAMILSGTMSVGALVAHDEKRALALVEANRKLEELSQRDALTGLHNRRHLMTRLEEELLWRKRGRPLAVVMLDLDRFKRVNDEDGHVRGDTLLANIGEALGRAVRATDVVGRYGGDEFVVLLPDTQGPQAEIAAQRLVLAVREVGLAFDARRPVTASVGLAIATELDEPRAFLQRADRAAYAAKARGGDRMATESDSTRPPARAQA
jgi:diguanylate cyclase (GGDEF)-like protein